MRDLVNWKDHVVEFPGRYEAVAWFSTRHLLEK